MACIAYPTIAGSSCGTLAAPSAPSATNSVVDRGYTYGRFTSLTDWVTPTQPTTFAYADLSNPGSVTSVASSLVDGGVGSATPTTSWAIR